MSQHRSIATRLSRAKSPQAREALLKDWVANWREDQFDIIRQFEQAIGTMDYDAFCIATGELKAVTEKRFPALENVLKKLQET